MKDGFDRSVAEKMPKIQKKRPNRPWNVDPVLMKVQHDVKPEDDEVQPVQSGSATVVDTLESSEWKDNPVEEEKIEVVDATFTQEPEAVIAQAVRDVIPDKTSDPVFEHIKDNVVTDENSENIAKAVETIKELNAEFTQILFDRKEIRQQLEKSSSTIEEVARENTVLKANLAVIEKNAQDNTLIEREIDFLNEQLEDADFYIQNMVGLLEEKVQSFEQEALKRKDLENRFQKMNKDIQEKAKMDVKISILEKDLSISNSKIFELESKLDEEYHKREPLELEIVELKNALDRVYSSLSHIRLKAKREVYGS